VRAEHGFEQPRHQATKPEFQDLSFSPAREMAWPISLGSVSAFDLPSPNLILTLPDFRRTFSFALRFFVVKFLVFA
jgi:hypothetical protein